MVESRPMPCFSSFHQKMFWPKSVSLMITSFFLTHQFNEMMCFTKIIWFISLWNPALSFLFLHIMLSAKQTQRSSLLRDVSPRNQIAAGKISTNGKHFDCHKCTSEWELDKEKAISVQKHFQKSLVENEMMWRLFPGHHTNALISMLNNWLEWISPI